MLWLTGMLIGFSIAAPVGPVGMLCISRSLKYGFKVGLLTGLGAATADGLYGLMAAFGVTALTAAMNSWQIPLRLAGGLFLAFLGIRIFYDNHIPEGERDRKPPSLPGAYLSTFFLTLANPMTIASFIGIFSGIGIGNLSTSHAATLVFVLGVTAGSACWWLLLSAGVAKVIHHRVSPEAIRKINAFSGSVLLFFAMAALISCVSRL